MYSVSVTVRGSLFRHCFYVKKSTASSVQGLIDQQSQGNTVKGSEGVNFLRSEENSFAASKRGSFFQEAPRLRNQFNSDFFLQSYLRRSLPSEVRLELTHLHKSLWGHLWGHPRCNIIYSFSLFSGLLSGLIRFIVKKVLFLRQL